MNRSEILRKFDQVARRRVALTTERSYRSWIVKYLAFLKTDKARKLENSESKMEEFLSGMAREEYSRVTQNQAFNALLFLYRHALKVELGDVSALRCKHTRSVRYVPSKQEIADLLHHLKNTPTYNVRLLTALLYGCGLRVNSACQLRIKDFDLERRVLTIHGDKGNKDRQVTIPESLLPALRRQIARSSALAQIDIDSFQPVQLPGRLATKYPSYQFEIGWHFLFPSPAPCKHPRTGELVRWCIGPDVIQRAVKRAAKAAGISGKVTPHCLRHSYCSDLLDAGNSLRRVQEAMGHTDPRTTLGYARKECLDLASPLDGLAEKKWA